MKNLCFLAILMLSSGLCLAQNHSDLITLKDGSILKGTISEYNPLGTLKMILTDGSLREIDSSKIKSFDEAEKRTFVSKEKGFFHTSTIGFLLGHDEYSNEVNFQYNMINGYKLRKLFFGFGTGIETNNAQIVTPFYGDVSYQFSASKARPFVSGQLGKVVNFGYEKDTDDFYYYNNNFKSGNMAGISIGINNSLSSELSLVLSAGYRYYDLKGDYTNRWWSGTEWLTTPVTTNTITHRFNLKIGLMFN